MQNNQIEEIKNKTDIVSLLGQYLELKKAGRNYKANCPFHGEKTPSFMVSPELQMYKCFGCGKSGDCFTFLEEHEGMEFKEALKYLADQAGVRLTAYKSEGSSEREKIIQINKNALVFYEYVLNSHPKGKQVLSYLTKDRGLKPEIIKQFRLGYSPENVLALYNYLSDKKKISSKDLQISGIVVGRNGNVDRFLGRVIFPLFDHHENLIGFAGRILPWARQDMAKYINSPDTSAYHKSKVLYGLNISKQHIRELGYAVIVEGELDMISSYQAGIKNVIAIKGSALTDDQIRLIGRFTKKIVLCLDSDFAGNEAAKRGAISASNLGFEVRVAHIEGYKDPDEIAKADPKKYAKYINEAIGIWDFLINMSIFKYGLDTGEGKRKISTEIIPLIATIEDMIVKAHYAELLSRKLSVPVEAVMAELQKKIGAEKTIQNTNFLPQQKTRKLLLEEKLFITAISTDPKLLFENKTKELFSYPLIIKLISETDKLYKKGIKINLKSFGQNCAKELLQYFSEIVLDNPESEEAETVIRELKMLNLKEKLEDLGRKIKEAEGDDSLLKEFSDLSKKLSTL